MKNSVKWVVLAFLLLLVAGVASAAQGTSAEAKALVNTAAAYIKANGKEKALAEFNNPKGKFIDRELYIFAYDFKGVNRALGSNPKMVGKNLLDLQDAGGKFLIRDLIDIAQKGGGWYEYKWSNPRTKKIHNKVSYVLKIDDNLFIGSGAYK